MVRIVSLCKNNIVANKKGTMMNQVIIQIILIGLVFALFFVSIAGKADGRGVARQVLEKELALLIDSAVPGMSFEVRKVGENGVVGDVRIENGRIFVVVNGLNSLKGYPYFSKYDVSVSDIGDKFVVRIE